MSVSFAARRQSSQSPRPARQFLAVFGGLYALWVLGYDGLLGPNNALDHALSTNLAAAAAAALQLAGWAARADPAAPALLVLNGQPAMLVGDPCNGLLLYALFAGFVVAFPGAGRHKCWSSTSSTLRGWPGWP